MDQKLSSSRLYLQLHETINLALILFHYKPFCNKSDQPIILSSLPSGFLGSDSSHDFLGISPCFLQFLAVLAGPSTQSLKDKSNNNSTYLKPVP